MSDKSTISFKVFSSFNKQDNEFYIKFYFIAYGIDSLFIESSKGTIAPFKGVLSSCEKDDNTLVLY